MNKKEVIERIDALLQETKIDEANAKTRQDEWYCVGKQNGLLWARLFVLNLEEK